MNLVSLRRSRAVRTIVRTVGVHRVVTVVEVLRLPLLKLAERLLPLVPRDRSLVVMGSPLDRFADNAAYLFVHVAEVGRGSRRVGQVPADPVTDLRAVWITASRAMAERLQSQGFDAYPRWSLRGVVSCVRAGAFVYSGYRSDINRLLSPGALAVALWHGVPIKRVERDLPSGRGGGILSRVTEAAREPAPDVLLSSSDHMTQTAFSRAFGVPPERCWALGYPRNDHLVAGRPAPRALLWSPEVYEELYSSEKVVGLFLTWRDDRVDDVLESDLLERLSEVCAAHGARVAYKAHYNVAATPSASANIVTVPADADLHAYLGLCDVLITDYSSVALDFLLLRRPILYYMPDLDDYAAKRGFYFDPLTLPGDISRTSTALLGALERTLDGTRDWSWSERDEAFLRNVWGDYAGGAAAALTAALTTRR
jgi:hypothetical protein